MLFINATPNSDAAKSYHREHLVRSDYYLKEAPEIVGEWHGRTAALLGLHGQVRQEEYFRLCDNLHPITGEQLTPRTKVNRRVAYDFTFDCPKSVSLAYEIGGDARILDAFRASAQETMREIENGMCVRVRANGQDHDRVSGNLVWASFVHRSTRPLGDGTPDPQLHLHAVAFNVSYDPEEERFKAGQFGQIKADAFYYQSAFHARLAKRLSDLGYGIEKEGDSFRLLGLDREVCDRFSRRTQEIEAEAEKRGITDLKQKSALGKMTRKGKGREAGIDELRAAWKERLSPEELRALKRLDRGEFQTRAISPAEAFDRAIERSFERASVVTEKQLAARALVAGVGSVLPADIDAQMKRPDMVKAELGGQRYVTTRDVCREELRVLRFAREGRGQCERLGGSETPALDAGLSSEQRTAAQTILRSNDRMIGLLGGAGTGKTRMMQATASAIEATGRTVYTFAPSADASRGVLRSEGFANADTVERLLRDESLHSKLRGQVAWIDEAGLLSTRDLHRVTDLAERLDCRLILSGDPRQHSSVVRGDALRLLRAENAIAFAELHEVRRQTAADYREAVTAISQGDAPGPNGKTQFGHGMDLLDRMGAIVEIEGDERYRRIADEYLVATSERKWNGDAKSVLVVTPTHAEARRVTEEVRTALKAAGKITNTREVETLSPLSWTTAERRDHTLYAAGMVAQFHQNVTGFARGERVRIEGRNDRGEVLCTRDDGAPAVLPLAHAERFEVYRPQKTEIGVGDTIRITRNGFTKDKHRLDNRSLYTVAGFAKNGDLKLSNGVVLGKDYQHFTHGITSTSHASQGRTVDRVLLAMGSESFAATNREQAYVSISRARESVRIFTDNKAALREAVDASAARLTATELTKAPPKQPNLLKRMMTHRRILDTYRAVRDRARSVFTPARRSHER